MYEDAEKIIWNYLLDEIGNAYGVAGLMGNLQAESGLYPLNVENRSGIDDVAYTVSVDDLSYPADKFAHDGFGYGLAQWTYWSRKQNLYQWQKSRGLSICDINGQLAFLMHELETSYKSVLSVLLTATSVKQASDVVLTQFERPRDQSEAAKNKRAEMGQKIYLRNVSAAPVKPVEPSDGLMRWDVFIGKLRQAHDVPNVYNNKFPYNCGYWDGKQFSWDCWNLIKSILGGWFDNRTVGYYVNPKDFPTGDISGAQMLAKCYNRSKDFSQLKTPGAYLYISNSPHSGVYVGDFRYQNETFNVVECTGAWDHKVQYTYVDEKGGRYLYKGGPKNPYSWTDWGLMPWIKY